MTISKKNKNQKISKPVHIPDVNKPAHIPDKGWYFIIRPDGWDCSVWYDGNRVENVVSVHVEAIPEQPTRATIKITNIHGIVIPNKVEQIDVKRKQGAEWAIDRTTDSTRYAK